MSFRWFIYYCALCGGCAAYLGWALGRFSSADNHIILAGVRGMCLGMLLAFSLGLIDALWDLGPSRVVPVALRVVTAVLIGSFGGFFGGVVGQTLYYGVARYGGLDFPPLLILGWALTGLLIGMAPGVHDLLARGLLSQ